MLNRIRRTDFGIRSTVHSTTIEIQFYSPSLVRVLKSPGRHNLHQTEPFGQFRSPRTTALAYGRPVMMLLMDSESIQVTLNLKSGTDFVHDTLGPASVA